MASRDAGSSADSDTTATTAAPITVASSPPASLTNSAPGFAGDGLLPAEVAAGAPMARTFGSTLPGYPNFFLPAPPTPLVPPPSLYRTEFQAFSAVFSPFNGQMVAAATSQYFGLAGNGKLQVLELVDGNLIDVRLVLGAPNPTHVTCSSDALQRRSFYCNNGLFDVAWSEINERQLATAHGDGGVKLWDLATPDEFPIAKLPVHTLDVASVNWNVVDKRLVLSASWDGTLATWDPQVPTPQLHVNIQHQAINGAMWHPRHASVIACAAEDHTVCIVDTAVGRPVLEIPAHKEEVLSVDWNKYDEFCVASAGADRVIRIWDTRHASAPVAQLWGHRYGVKRIRFSPFEQHILASVSFDKTARIWDWSSEDALILQGQHHTEFVLALDWSLFNPGAVVTGSWDRSIVVWNIKSGPPPTVPKLANAPAPPVQAPAGDHK